jgi:hypothetical protein
MAISTLHALTQAERDQSQPRPANDNRKPNSQDTNLQEHAAEESGNDRKTCRKRDPCQPRKLVTPQAEDRVEQLIAKLRKPRPPATKCNSPRVLIDVDVIE